MPSPFWMNPSAETLLSQSELTFHRSKKKNLNLDSDEAADPDSSRVQGSSSNRSKIGRPFRPNQVSSQRYLRQEN